jgi:hypothetical protein
VLHSSEEAPAELRMSLRMLTFADQLHSHLMRGNLVRLPRRCGPILRAIGLYRYRCRRRAQKVASYHAHRSSAASTLPFGVPGLEYQSAVPDPDVVLLADAVLANRPVTSAAQREEGNAATAAAAPSSSSTRRGSLLGKIGRSRKAPLPQSERPGRDVVADDGDWGAYAGNGLESALDANALEAMSSRSVGISRHNTPPHEGAATTPGDSLRRKVELLSAQLAATEAALRASQEQSHHWQLCVRDLFNGLLLNPRMNSKYELKASKMLEHAIAKLDLIGARTRRSHTPARWREAEPARAQCTRLRTRRGPSWPPLSLPAQPALRPPP